MSAAIDTPVPRGPESIEIVGARTNNLRGVSCTVPLGEITVVTGVSGSGKSSLAFDTVYAEGQRRYVETLSTYARQFLDQMRKPPFSALRHLPPALALRQGNSITNARSTVASVSEVGDLLRLLYAGAGHVICYECGARVHAHDASSVREWLEHNLAGERIVVLGRVSIQDQDAAVLLRQLAADGYRRVWVGEGLADIDSPDALDALKDRELHVVIDRIKVEPGASRMAEAIESAFALGDAVCEIRMWDRKEDGAVPVRSFDSRMICDECGTEHVEPMPALFHSTSEVGKCKRCDGYGRTIGIDITKVVADPRLTLEEGAVACFQVPTAAGWQRELIAAAKDAGVDVDTPWFELEPRDRKWVLEGDSSYTGVYGFFKSLEPDRYKAHVRMFVARYRGYTDCTVCRGSGLSPVALAVRIGDEDIGDILALRIEQAVKWAAELQFDEALEDAIDSLLKELRERLGYLDECGIGYLTLNRQGPYALRWGDPSRAPRSEPRPDADRHLLRAG